MRKLLCAWVALFSSVTTMAHAAPIDLSGFQINGDAQVQGSEIRLTDSSNSQRGSAFSQDAVALSPNGFRAMFELSIGRPGNSGADGIVFVMHNSALGPTALGVGGGGIGYRGIGNSIAVEFDTWNNGFIDLWSENHVGINVNGSTFSRRRANPGFDLDSANFFAWVEYDGTSLDVSVSQSATQPGTTLLSYTTDLSQLGGEAYIGFTASTGGARAEHRVRSFDFEVLATVPLPAGGVMLLTGLGALMVRRRVARTRASS